MPFPVLGVCDEFGINHDPGPSLFNGTSEKKSPLLLFYFILFFNKFIYFIYFYFWLRWVFVAVCGLSLVVASGDYSSLWCTGFSLRWLPLLRSTGSRCAGFL